jgi:hypothetical protein
MSDANRRLYLRIALIFFGLTFIFGIYPLGIVWASGWAWGQGHSHYLMMIIGIYATLGVFLLIASRSNRGSSQGRGGCTGPHRGGSAETSVGPPAASFRWPLR